MIMARDAFDVLGVRPVFDLRREEIGGAYLSLAQRLHPDMARGDADAAARMAEVNQAKRVLENPESRAEALLMRLGGPEASKERSLPEGFLMEMMGVRERVEQELAGEGGSAQREAWERWSREQREEASRVVGELFGRAEREAGGAKETLREIRVRLNAWRYIERLIEQLEPGGA